MKKEAGDPRPDGPPEPTWDQKILALVPSGIDVTLIEESLRLTPTERLARMREALLFLERNRGIVGHGLRKAS